MGIMPSSPRVKVNRTHAKVRGGFYVILRVVTDVDTIARRHTKINKCLQEDRWFRFGHPEFP